MEIERIIHEAELIPTEFLPRWRESLTDVQNFDLDHYYYSLEKRDEEIRID